MKRNIIVGLILMAAGCIANAADTNVVKQTPNLLPPVSEYSKVEVQTYATASWNKLGGSSRGGVGLGLSYFVNNTFGFRVSAEADSWKPKDYVIDRAFFDTIIQADIGHGLRPYGFGGFGYSLTTDSVAAHAGVGTKLDIVRFADNLAVGLFTEGGMEADTSGKTGFRLSGGLNLRF